MKVYGNLINRFNEGRNYADDKLIHEGDDITMYMWSDRHCYYVTKVIDQKHIFVKEYFVCADHDAPSMSNTWKYFKDPKEIDNYLNKYFPDYEYNHVDAQEEEWMFRYGSWRRVSYLTKQSIIDWLTEDTNYAEKAAEEQDIIFNNYIKRYELNESKINKLKNGEALPRYYELSGKVSFGVRNYYYDYEF